MAVFIVVACFIAFDIVTGIIKALYNGGINSTALRKGLYHKLSEIVSVAGSVLLELGADYINIGVELPILNVVSVYICVMELVSILENLSNVNPSLSKLFKPYLEKLKKEDVENDSEKRN